MNFSNKKVLVVAAHPDDEVLGCGGTIARFVNEGSEVTIVLMGEGPQARHDSKEEGMQNKDVSEVQSFAKKAANALGVTDLRTFSFPDNAFDSIPLLDLVKAIESVKSEVKPDIVFTHSASDLNVDHVLTHRAALTACRSMEGESVKEIYAFEIASSTEWNVPYSFSPTMYVNIHDTLDAKIEALKCYETEIRDFPHPRSEKNLRAMATVRGATSAFQAAEAFEVLRVLHG
jgi:LmbE family N-acetylglucosaminyl deacetylase